MSKQTKKIKIPIYDRILRIFIAHDIEEVLSDIGHGDDEPVEASVIVSGENDDIILVLRPDANINTICHESFHITNEILSAAGLKLSNKSEEAYAYLNGFVAEKIHIELQRFLYKQKQL